MILYRILADLVLCIHVAIVGFNVLGLLFIIDGLLCSWCLLVRGIGLLGRR